MNRHLWRRRHVDTSPLEHAMGEARRGGYQAGRADEDRETRRQINAVLMHFGLAPIEHGPLDLGIRDALTRTVEKANQRADELEAHGRAAATRALTDVTTAITSATGIAPREGETPVGHTGRALASLLEDRDVTNAALKEATERLEDLQGKADTLRRDFITMQAQCDELEAGNRELAELRQYLAGYGTPVRDGETVAAAAHRAIGVARQLGADVQARLQQHADSTAPPPLNAARRALQQIAGHPTRMVVTTSGGRAKSILVEREDGSREALPFPVTAVRLDIDTSRPRVNVQFRCEVTVEPEAEDEATPGPWTIRPAKPAEPFTRQELDDLLGPAPDAGADYRPAA